MGKSASSAKTKADTVHPAAPAGGGGPGKFRDVAGPLGAGAAPAFDAHPRAPAGRYVVAANVSAVAAATAATKAPPTTVTGTTRVKLEKTSSADIDVSVEVLPDATGADITGAKTTISGDGVTYSTPGYSGHKRKDGTEVIDSLDGPYEIKGTITIQTVYGAGSKATDTSVYGRGTTAKDKADGNTSLGFHEYCHRQDYLGYLKSKPLPVFTGKAGMTATAYQAAATAFENAGKRYLKDMEAESKRKTDETGYKKSQCVKDGKCRS